LTVTTCGWGVIGGTSVGSGASLIVTTGAAACTGAGVGVGVGSRSSALITAQPPSVAASDAAVINSFTPGALVAGFLEGLVMIITMIVVVVIVVIIVMIVVVIVVTIAA
jgi:hypothetical protein